MFEKFIFGSSFIRELLWVYHKKPATGSLRIVNIYKLSSVSETYTETKTTRQNLFSEIHFNLSLNCQFYPGILSYWITAFWSTVPTIQSNLPTSLSYRNRACSNIFSSCFRTSIIISKWWVWMKKRRLITFVTFSIHSWSSILPPCAVFISYYIYRQCKLKSYLPVSYIRSWNENSFWCITLPKLNDPVYL